MDKVLHFWNQNNVIIIEGLIGLIVLLSLIVAYRTFFGAKANDERGAGASTNGSLDAVQLEKTLQKILENQNLGAKLAANEDLSVDADIDANLTVPAEAGEEAPSPELAQLRAALGESQKKMEALKVQLTQAQEQAAQAQAMAAAAPAAAAGGGEAGASPATGMSSEEREDLSGKLRDLEARLAEYEIISEDIADLSRYREENDDLKKQIEALKASGGGSAPEPAAPPVQEAASAPAPEPEPEAPKLEVVKDEAPPEPAAAPESAADTNLIDDDLMKEFAAAVEGQKALDKAAEKAGDGSEKAATNADDTSQLMNEFENFVGTKKS